jgi:hypothetical protein
MKVATTRRDRVGRIREVLADLLNEEVPYGYFRADRLDSQVPVYATPQWDCCSWYGDGVDLRNGMNIHVASWSTMSRCVQRGIEVLQLDTFSWDVFPK